MRIRFLNYLKSAVLPAAVLSLTLCASAASVTGGMTSVALDAGAVTALTGFGFSIAAVSPATLAGATATFPITGGDTTTMIDHSGGLAFTKGGVTADIEDFIINLSGPQADTITGQLVAGSTVVTGVTLFDIGTGATLTLDAQLASELSAAYGIPNLTGAPIGTATIDAATAPEPSTLGFAILALVGSAFVLHRRQKPTVPVTGS